MDHIRIWYVVTGMRRESDREMEKGKLDFILSAFLLTGIQPVECGLRMQ